MAALVCTFVPTAWAQVDNVRMNRDVKVMSHALNEMISEEMNAKGMSELHFGSKSHTGKYVPGFGIMLQIPRSSRIIINQGSRSRTTSLSYPGEKFSEEDMEEMTAIVKDFLLEYGDLASQLDPEENIMVYFGSNDHSSHNVHVYSQNGRTLTRSGSNESARFSIKVQKKFLDQYKKGNMTEDAIREKMVVVQGEATEGSDRSFKVLAKILQSLYERDEESRLFFSDEEEEMEEDWPQMFMHKSNFKGVSYQVIQGMGVTYELKLGYPLKGYGSDMWRWSGKEGRVIINLDDISVDVDTDDEEGDNDEDEEDNMGKSYLRDRDESIERVYPDFKEEMVRQMVEYGRTLRGLEPDEFFIVNAEMPACFECNLPAQVEFKIKKSLLEDFDSRKVNLDAAMDQVQVSETGKASELMDFEKKNRIRSSRSNTTIRGRGRSYREQ